MFESELKTYPSVIAEVLVDSILANLTCHIFKMSWGNMPADPPSSPKTFSSLLRGSEFFLRICCASVTIQAGSAPVKQYTQDHRQRIVSSYFNDNCKVKQNKTMNVNRSQKHGPMLHFITQAKSRTTNITVMHHTLTHFNL